MNPTQPPDPLRRGAYIDHETGLIHFRNQAPLPLVGSTSGSDYQRLKQNEERAKRMKLQTERQLRSVWACTQCKRRFSWFNPNAERGILKRAPRIKQTDLDSTRIATQALVCFDPGCDAPVVMQEDALSLRAMPGR
jgi:hypothetical protein